MALQADIQKLVDEVRANTDLSKSIEAALALQAKQIADLQAKLGAINPGQTLSDEDLTALQKAASDLGETNAGLTTAIPANTTPTP